MAQEIEQSIARLKADIGAIRQNQDRTGRVAERHLRWQGIQDNPNGWRLMGDLADDLEQILRYIGD